MALRFVNSFAYLATELSKLSALVSLGGQQIIIIKVVAWNCNYTFQPNRATRRNLQNMKAQSALNKYKTGCHE